MIILRSNAKCIKINTEIIAGVQNVTMATLVIIYFKTCGLNQGVHMHKPKNMKDPDMFCMRIHFHKGSRLFKLTIHVQRLEREYGIFFWCNGQM